ncbi:hypothetical protein CEXT_171241 [Caerostris extrusa]|uniref:Uncharacterized protein n=1 Tax=Caerostris extrusa TaxID=172846 RepID=A0AAV4Y3E3_CAEEX|nr:hypothetical protein CEXT_171241 [Caerostris extrusa]
MHLYGSGKEGQEEAMVGVGMHAKSPPGRDVTWGTVEEGVVDSIEVCLGCCYDEEENIFVNEVNEPMLKMERVFASDDNSEEPASDRFKME